MSHICEYCDDCGYCTVGVRHKDTCGVAAEGTAPTATPAAQATPTDVAVPTTGAYLVIDGVVRRAVPVVTMLGPTRDGRIRWGVVTQSEVDQG